MAKYKYNGVVLPALPAEWDSATYPHAFIFKATATGKYYLFCSDVAVSAVQTESYTMVVWFPDETNVHFFECTESDSVWSVSDSYDENITSGDVFANLNPDTTEVIWTNTDISDDTTVYYEASEPVPVFDLKSFLTGLTLGLAGKPVLIGGQKTPVAYLYNGVRLPKLPEYDKTVYPYAVIVPTAVNRLLLTTAPLRCQTGTLSIYKLTESGSMICYTFGDTDTEWTRKTQYDSTLPEDGEVLTGSNLVPMWANYDLWHISVDELILAASDPVPVYE